VLYYYTIYLGQEAHRSTPVNFLAYRLMVWHRWIVTTVLLDNRGPSISSQFVALCGVACKRRSSLQFPTTTSFFPRGLLPGSCVSLFLFLPAFFQVGPPTLRLIPLVSGCLSCLSCARAGACECSTPQVFLSCGSPKEVHCLPRYHFPSSSVSLLQTR